MTRRASARARTRRELAIDNAVEGLPEPAPARTMIAALDAQVWTALA